MIDMRDALTGGALAAGGIAMVVAALQFPTIGAMAYGPGLFPKIVAGGLILSGIGIAAEGLQKRDLTEADDPIRPAPLMALVAIVAAFALGLDWLGFHIAAVLALIASVKLFQGSWLTAMIFAPLATVLLHMLFYNVLRVPLPWGLLLPVAW